MKPNAKNATESNSIPNHVYEELLKRTELLTSELESFRQKSPLVGIRWYGDGGCGISLTRPINGQLKFAVKGYGDKAVVDLACWNRLRSTEGFRDGVMVRDDKVIDEFEINGVKALPDKEFQKSPNGFTDAEIKKLLKGSMKTLKSVLDKMSRHQGPMHFLRVAKNLEFENESVLSQVKKRASFLFVLSNNKRKNIHELRHSCEIYKVRFDGMDEAEMVNVLTDKELEFNKAYEFF